MGNLVKMIDGKPVVQDYTPRDVISAIQNIAGDKPNGKKPQLAFVVDQLNYVKSNNPEAIKQVVRILQDISRDIKEVGEFVGSLCT